MRTSFILAALAAATVAFPIEAQTHEDVRHNNLVRSHRMVYLGDSEGSATQETRDSLIEIFYQDQFMHAQDARAPYFLFMSRSADIAMGIGGNLQGNMSYDFDGTISGSDFAPYSISVPHDPANPTEFQTSIAETSLVATVFGRTKHRKNFIINITAKFGGPSNTFKLKKAYITIDKLTVGLHKSTFCDPAATPSTVETMGPSGAVNDTRFLVRYIQPISKSKWSVAASVEMPDNTYDCIDGVTASTSAFMPDIAAYVQYGNKSHLRLAGIVKGMRYRDVVKQDNRRVTGYGVNLTALGRLMRQVTFYGSVNYGRGIGSMLNNLSKGTNDMLSYSSTGDRSGRMYAPTTLGWYAGVQYNFTPSLFATLLYSQDRLYTRKATELSNGDYKYGMYAVANVFWDITPRIQVGAEFDWGRRVDHNGEAANAHRIGLCGSFHF